MPDKIPAPTTQLRKPQLCRPCGVTELHASNETAASVRERMRMTQKHAALLLGSAQELASGADTPESCPAKEWELMLAMLGEALAQHCRTCALRCAAAAQTSRGGWFHWASTTWQAPLGEHHSASTHGALLRVMRTARCGAKAPPA